MNPKIFRFPGGNYVEGVTVGTRWNWKQTIGPVWERPGHQNSAWGYWSDDGLGLLEYLQLTEDLGVTPVMAVWAGLTLNGTPRQPASRSSPTPTPRPATPWPARTP
jgi:alpha-L-arabinofuranosidase